MKARWKLLVRGLVLAGLIALASAQGTEASRSPSVGQRAARMSPPMFSAAYGDALRDVAELEPRDVARLEERLKKNPDDFAARLKLLAYSMRADPAGLPESRRRRSELVLWLVEHRPDSEILASPFATLSAGDLTADQLQRARRLWESATKAHERDARVMWNAATYFQWQDHELYVAFLERAVALAPGNANYAQPLGLLYAGAIIGADPRMAARATKNLDATQNAFLLEAAVRLLQSEYNKSLMMGKAAANVGETARRYFQRAKALDPGLDEAWIFPKIDPKMVGMLAPGARRPDVGAAQFESAAKAIRRLRPDAFPGLPEAIRGVLRSRGCLVPQPVLDGQPRNVIRGEFFAKGETAWAVLCSKDGFSSILVFPDNSDGRQEELAHGEDMAYLQSLGGDTIGYSRAIEAVDRKFIMVHYRAYGGAEPPPIDHQGIDDAFVGKASVTHYRHRGKWLKLQGAD